jgi:hypothetical protein
VGTGTVVETVHNGISRFARWVGSSVTTQQRWKRREEKGEKRKEVRRREEKWKKTA